LSEVTAADAAPPAPRRYPLRRKPGAADMPLPGAKFVSVRQFCAHAGVSEAAVYAAFKRGDITRLKCGRKTLLDLAAAEQWLRGKRPDSEPIATAHPPEPETCPRCQGTVWWRTAARSQWACKRCRVPGRVARHGDYEERGGR
jgi:hypothetical protein